MQRIIMALRWLDSFSGSITPKKVLKKLRHHTDRQRLGKIATTIVLDKDEHLL